MGKGEGSLQQIHAPRVNWMASTLLVIMMLVVTPLTAVAEAQHNPQQLYAVDLPPQTIAESLNQLARQTGAQFLFPFQLTQSKAARPVKGRFTLLQATQYLLHNTGLTGDLVDGVLTISQIYCEPGETGCDPNNLYGNDSKKGKRMNIKNSSTRKTLLAGLVGVFAAGGMTQATAQGGEAATGQSAIDEIIVTANKREQSLQDTALAISAITEEGLAARGIESGYDLQFSVPGLTIGESTAGPAQVTLRGVGMGNIFLGGDPGVPIHIDGHYVQDSKYILQGFTDVERVEVLRGPQGTLYGRNAIGGSINIITKRPKEEFEASLGIDLGNYDKRLLQGSISGPLTDDLRGRFSISDEKRDGFVENISLSGGQDYKNSDYTSLRGLLEYDLTDSVLVTFSGYYFEDFGNNNVARNTSEIATGMPPGFVDYYTLNNAQSNPTVSDPRKVRFNAGDDVFNRAQGASVDIEWDLDGMRLRSLSSYNNSKSSILSDSDASDVVTLAHGNFRRSHETFSQEFQLLSAADSKLEWILGLFYYDEDSDGSETFDWDNFFVADGSKSILDTFYDLNSTALGVFGQVEYPLTDKLSIVGGLRYNKDKKSNVGILDIPDFGLLAITVADSNQWEEITGKIGFDYHIDDDVMLYASYATGYKAGGYSLIQPSYDPETVEAYETGLKGLWFDRKMQASLSAFYYDYTDKQEFQRDNFSALITNAGAATVWGLELEGTATPFSAFTIDASVAYLNAEYDEFNTIDNVDAQRLALGLQDLSGNKVPRSPEWKVHLGLQYEWTMGLGQLLARVDTVWVDEQFSAPFNRQDRDLMDSYHRTNAQVSWESDSQLWQASLYVQNLEDDDVVANLFDGSDLVGLPVAVYGHYFEPRTFGVKLTRNF